MSVVWSDVYILLAIIGTGISLAGLILPDLRSIEAGCREGPGKHGRPSGTHGPPGGTVRGIYPAGRQPRGCAIVRTSVLHPPPPDPARASFNETAASEMRPGARSPVRTIPS